MRELSKYDIEIFQLKNKHYAYDYALDDSFFESIEGSMVSKGSLTARLELTKTEQMIVIQFIIIGKIELICDRSLEPFDYAIDVNSKIIYKFGDEDKEISEDMYVIRKETLVINVAQPIYELIGVEIPFKKLHPRFKENSSDDEVELIYRTNQNDEVDEEPNEDNIDPRWKELLKLRKN